MNHGHVSMPRSSYSRYGGSGGHGHGHHHAHPHHAHAHAHAHAHHPHTSTTTSAQNYLLGMASAAAVIQQTQNSPTTTTTTMVHHHPPLSMPPDVPVTVPLTSFVRNVTPPFAHTPPPTNTTPPTTLTRTAPHGHPMSHSHSHHHPSHSYGRGFVTATTPTPLQRYHKYVEAAANAAKMEFILRHQEELAYQEEIVNNLIAAKVNADMGAAVAVVGATDSPPSALMRDNNNNNNYNHTIRHHLHHHSSNNNNHNNNNNNEPSRQNMLGAGGQQGLGGGHGIKLPPWVHHIQQNHQHQLNLNNRHHHHNPNNNNSNNDCHSESNNNGSGSGSDNDNDSLSSRQRRANGIPKHINVCTNSLVDQDEESEEGIITLQNRIMTVKNNRPPSSSSSSSSSSPPEPKMSGLPRLSRSGGGGCGGSAASWNSAVREDLQKVKGGEYFYTTKKTTATKTAARLSGGGTDRDSSGIHKHKRLKLTTPTDVYNVHKCYGNENTNNNTSGMALPTTTLKRSVSDENGIKFSPHNNNEGYYKRQTDDDDEDDEDDDDDFSMEQVEEKDNQIMTGASVLPSFCRRVSDEDPSPAAIVYPQHNNDENYEDDGGNDIRNDKEREEEEELETEEGLLVDTPMTMTQVRNNNNSNNNNNKENVMVLASPEDPHWLSDLVCLIRENIEVFCATADDVVARSKRGGIKKPIVLGRVGLRCKHCTDLVPDARAKGAVSYPFSIRIIHQAVRNWQRYHFNSCPYIPPEVRQAYQNLKSTRSHSGNASLQYWIDSAAAMGMVDTPDGIRMVPTNSSNSNNNNNNPNSNNNDATQPLLTSTATNVDATATPTPTGTIMIENNNHNGANLPMTMEMTTHHQPLSNSNNGNPSNSNRNNHHATQGQKRALVKPSDRSLITDFLYELLDQQQICFYSKVDRNGKRKYREIGTPGVECKHCARNAGAGRYFPILVTTLANNNNPFNCTHSHMMKCRRCPEDVKQRLALTQMTHARQGFALPQGWKKDFFDILWKRLHATTHTEGSPSPQPQPQEETHDQTPVEMNRGQSQATLVPDHVPTQEHEQEQEDSHTQQDMDSAALALSTFSARAFEEARMQHL